MVRRTIDFGGDKCIAERLDKDIQEGLDFSSSIMVRIFFLTALFLLRDKRYRRSVYAVGKVPTIASVCDMSGKLGYSVQLTLTPAETCRDQEVLKYRFPQMFDHQDFLSFMRKINAFGKQNCLVADKEERARLLALFYNPGFSARWHQMMRFVWLCGYRFECRPVPLDCMRPLSEQQVPVE